MISVTDLRINNWVKAPIGEWMQVKQLGHKDSPNYIFAEGPQGFGANGFEGIELSPDILEKCGFVKSKGFGWDLEDSRFSLDITFTPAWREVICSPNRIKYLHQLQNLYFALTGEELTLNL